jgi:hypothetical protein
MNSEVQLDKKEDLFWFENPKILFSNKRWVEFFPTPELTLTEKLNSLVRLSFYICLVLLVFYQNYLYLYIPIFTLLFTYLIYKNNKHVVEALTGKEPIFESELAAADPERQKLYKTNLSDTKVVDDKNCVLPTLDNPFMNINQITDKRNREPACKYYNNEEVAKDVEKDFNFNLYRDVSDLYNKHNSQREYYTMPSTTIPNDQTSFARWCYLSPPTCKEESVRCVPYTTQPPLPGKGLADLELKN